MATRAHQTAQVTQDSSDYRLAIDNYNSYLVKFPDAANNPKIMFYLSECYYEQGDYETAADNYYELMITHPRSEFQEPAAYHRILALQYLPGQHSEVDSVDLFMHNFLGQNPGAADSMRVANKWQAQLLQALNDFSIYHPDSEYIPGVLMTYAALFYELNDFYRSEQVYHFILDSEICRPYWLLTQFQLAQSNFQQQDYSGCLQWTSRIIAGYPDSTNYVRKAYELMSRAKFRGAEKLLAKGDTLQAALAFADIAATGSDSTVAERALYQSGMQFEASGSSARAVQQYDKLVETFPGSPLRVDAAMRAAVLSEKTEDWLTAARYYQTVADISPVDNFGAAACFNAARCWESGGEFNKARETYQAYMIKYHDDRDRYLEAAFRKAEIAWNTKDRATAQKEFQFVVDSRQRFADNNIATDDYYVANAQFLLAEMQFESFQEVELKPPLQRNLKLKKKLFERVIKTYTAAAGYKVAEWTTAASYRLGETFEAFAEALLTAPVPGGMSDEQLQEYNTKLQETILPFKQKALQAYETNIRQAELHSIENYWVVESKRRLNVLSAELEIKPSELTEKRGI
jgi:TolA-binding protein